jgi:hypothetical protein
MFKKLLLIGTFCISLVGLSGTQAAAYPPDVGDVNVCMWCSCPPLPAAYCSSFSSSISLAAFTLAAKPSNDYPDPLTTPIMTLDSKIVGIGGLQETSPAEAYWKIWIREGVAYIINPGGQGNWWANGIPWQGDAVIEGNVTPEDPGAVIDKHGNWHAIIPIYTSDVQDILDLPEPQNPNWLVLFVVKRALYELNGVANANDQCEDCNYDPDYCWELFEDQCYPTYGTTGDRWLEEVFKGEYEFGTRFDNKGMPLLGEPGWVSELFHWDFGNNDPTCIYPDPEDPKRGDPYPCEYVFPPLRECVEGSSTYWEYWWNTTSDDNCSPLPGSM